MTANRKPNSETMAISEFKATCLAVLERVRRTGTSVIVTRRGKPVAEIVPPSGTGAETGWLGAMQGSAHMADDLIAPVTTPGDWDVLRP